MDELNNILPLIATGVAAAMFAILLTSIAIYMVVNRFWVRFRKSFQNDFLKYLSTEMSDMAMHEKIMAPMQKDLLEHFDYFMHNKLPDEIPVLKMFVDEKLIAELKAVFNTELLLILPGVIEKNFTDSNQLKSYFKEGVRDLANNISEKFYNRIQAKVPLFLFVAFCTSLAGGLLAALLSGVIFTQ